MTACPLFVELCAGTAAVSLRLARARARPPVSRMGSKAGWGDCLLGLAGLRPGQGAGHYLWCEPDPGCRLLLEAYRDAALAKAAADIIRGWAGEDPRALWERLRAEGPPASPGGQVFAHEVARWAWVQGRGFHGAVWGASFLPVEHPVHGTNGTSPKATADRLHSMQAVPATIAHDARAVDPREVARHLYVEARRFQGGGGYAPESYDDPGRTGWPGCGPPRPELAARLESAKVDPREVARWGLLGQWLFRRSSPESGFNSGAVDERPGCKDEHSRKARTAADEARLWERLAGDLPATILPDAHAADPGPALPAGTVTLLDPPYVGTTPYAHDLPRADVVAIARRWAAAGALVMVCEAEPIPELVAEGWQARDIAHARRGQARTFSRQTREVVTMNRAPVHVPAEQVGLFGGSP